MARVFIISRDWKERALVVAQLREEGVEAEGFLTPGDAASAWALHTARPALIVTDFASIDDPLDHALLQKWADKIPVWIIASRTIREDTSIKTAAFEKILLRPIIIGDLVAQIRKRIG